MLSAQKSFSSVAPYWMARLRSDFDLSELDAAAVFGNGGYECLGFTKLQEMAPTVKGSRGGWGLMQWTGPRRRAFEAWCAKHKKDLSSLDTNYAWLFLELKGSERHAVAALRNAKTLEAKVIAFEKAFLRAGVKNYPKRLEWAKIVLAAYQEQGPSINQRFGTISTSNPTLPTPTAAVAQSGVAAVGSIALAAVIAFPWWAWILLMGAAIAGVIAWPRRHAIATSIRIAIGKL